MGDPRKIKRRYARPQHLWREERIAEEEALGKKYGLKNRKEIWKFKSKIRKFRQQARKLLADTGEEAKKEEKELLDKLRRLSIEVKNLEDVLALKDESLLERRLESLVYKKSLANSAKQARQLITHGHVLVDGKVVNIPSYLVSKDEENKIAIKEGINIVKPEEKESGKEKRKKKRKG